MASLEKKARRQGRVIVFIDETGVSTRPHRVRTWAPRGRTPVIRETFGWKSLSIIGAVSLWRILFRIHPGAIKGAEVVDFLKALSRHIPQPLLVIWDGAPIHRSRIVSDHVASTRGRIVVERLPAYAPELNPAEYIWAHLKQHEIGNLLVKEAWQLSHYASAALKRMHRRPRIIRACFAQATLWPD
jgi:transposase